MHRKQRVSSIPSLKRKTDWILDAEKKANYFVDTFELKNIIIEKEINEYSEIACDNLTFYCGLQILEATEEMLRALNESSALGPDMVPTWFLEQCSHVLAPILHKLINAMLSCGELQILRMMHWVFHCVKRKSAYDLGNCKGTHLTAQISKFAAKVIASLLVPQLIRNGTFGCNQFAYIPERSAREPLAQLLRWRCLFCKKHNIAI